ncbi:hypothetical protein ACWCYY_14315 [Kitasatospora sp. NPDC001664]
MRTNTLGRAAAALLSAVLLAVAAPAVTASAAEAEFATLGSGERLEPGEALVSGEAALVMQEDGNLVLRLVNDQGDLGPAVWASGTYGNRSAYAVMQEDGNFVVYRQNGAGALWSTRSWGHPGATLTMLGGWLRVGDNSTYWNPGTGLGAAVQGNGTPREGVVNQSRVLEPGQWVRSNSVWLLNQQDGNVVLYRKRDGAALWSTGTWNRPGQGLTVNNIHGNLYLRDMNTHNISWTLPTRNQPNAYAKVQDDGNFVLYSQTGQPLWSTGTWGNW